MTFATPKHEPPDRPSEASRARRGWALLTSPLGLTSIAGGPNTQTILRRDAIYRRTLALADVVAALAALECVFVVTSTTPYRQLPSAWTVLLLLGIVVIAKLLGLYDRDELLLRKSTLDESAAVFLMATVFAMLVTLSDRQMWGVQLLPRQLLLLWTLVFVFTLLARWCGRQIAHRVAPAERCLVVGDARAMESIRSRLPLGRNINAELVGQLPFQGERDHSLWLRMLERRVRDDDVHRVILAPQVSDSDVVLEVVRMVKDVGVKVSLLPRLFEVVGSSVVFDDIGGVTVLGVRRFGLSRSSAAIKRAMDLAGAVVGLAAAAPLMAIIAVAIRLDSGGPVLFRQNRVGRDGERFSMLKFRSMVRDAEAAKVGLRDSRRSAAMFKLAGDPRVTRVGRWLRVTSLDELPQLLNVLRGDMSLVGPRPLILDEDALVRGWQRRRLQLTPGMTGPWQILGSTRVPLDEMVKMDYLYIANWSLFADIKIILRTILHMVGRSGV